MPHSHVTEQLPLYWVSHPRSGIDPAVPFLLAARPWGLRCSFGMRLRLLRTTIGVSSHFLKRKNIPHSRIIECELALSGSPRSDRILDATLDFIEARHPSLGVTREWLADGISLKTTAAPGPGPIDLCALMTYDVSDLRWPDFLHAPFKALLSELGPPPPDRAFALEPMLDNDRQTQLEQVCRFLGHLATWENTQYEWIDVLCANIGKAAPSYIGDPIVIHLPKEIVAGINHGAYKITKTGYRQAVPVEFRVSDSPTHVAVEVLHYRDGSAVAKSLILRALKTSP